MTQFGPETICTHLGENPELTLGSVVPPIFQNSLFLYPDCESFTNRVADTPTRFDYTRSSNPTIAIAEAKIASLEHAEAARCCGSGMGAVSAAILHAVRAGDHIVSVETVYGPTYQFMSQYLPKVGVTVTFVEGSNIADFEAAIRPNTRLIYLESPSTMLYLLQDLADVANLAREHSIVTVIDNSWASPIFQQPIRFGIDLVVHSATKYLGGHSDIVGGVIAGSTERIASIRQWEGALLGSVMDPFAAWLLVRGIRTLPLRMERHQFNGMQVASYMDSHPAVAQVHYPGLASHPQYKLGRRQLSGTSGLMTIFLHDKTREGVFRFIDKLQLFGIGVSWGGFESLAIPLEFHSDGSLGHLPGRGTSKTDKLWGVRLHIGLETVEDLLIDLDQALS